MSPVNFGPLLEGAKLDVRWDRRNCNLLSLSLRHSKQAAANPLLRPAASSLFLSFSPAGWPTPRRLAVSPAPQPSRRTLDALEMQIALPPASPQFARAAAGAQTISQQSPPGAGESAPRPARNNNSARGCFASIKLAADCAQLSREQRRVLLARQLASFRRASIESARRDENAKPPPIGPFICARASCARAPLFPRARPARDGLKHLARALSLYTLAARPLSQPQRGAPTTRKANSISSRRPPEAHTLALGARAPIGRACFSAPARSCASHSSHSSLGPFSMAADKERPARGHKWGQEAEKAAKAKEKTRACKLRLQARKLCARLGRRAN